MRTKIILVLAALMAAFLGLKRLEHAGAPPVPPAASAPAPAHVALSTSSVAASSAPAAAPPGEPAAQASQPAPEAAPAPAPAPAAPLAAPTPPAAAPPMLDPELKACIAAFDDKPFSEKDRLGAWEGYGRLLDHFACRAYAEGKTSGEELDGFLKVHFEPRLRRDFIESSGLDRLQLLHLARVSRAAGRHQEALMLCQMTFKQPAYAPFVEPSALNRLCGNLVKDYAEGSSNLCSHPEFFRLKGADLAGFAKDCKALFGAGEQDCSRFKGPAAARCQTRSAFLKAVAAGKPELCPPPGPYSSLCRAMLSSEPALVCARSGQASAFEYCDWKKGERMAEEANRRVRALKKKEGKGAAGEEPAAAQEPGQ